MKCKWKGIKGKKTLIKSIAKSVWKQKNTKKLHRECEMLDPSYPYRANW